MLREWNLPYPGGSHDEMTFSVFLKSLKSSQNKQKAHQKMGSASVKSTRVLRSAARDNLKTPQEPVLPDLINTVKAGQPSQKAAPSVQQDAPLPPASMKPEAHEITEEDVSYQVEKEKKVKKPKVTNEEKRLRRFRPKPPQSFHEIYDRALSQRFYVLNRVRGGTQDCPEEDVEMTGSTGNIYTVHVGKQPRCTCPHHEKGHQCKHILYVSITPKSWIALLTKFRS